MAKTRIHNPKILGQLNLNEFEFDTEHGKELAKKAARQMLSEYLNLAPATNLANQESCLVEKDGNALCQVIIDIANYARGEDKAYIVVKNEKLNAFKEELLRYEHIYHVVIDVFGKVKLFFDAPAAFIAENLIPTKQRNKDGKLKDEHYFDYLDVPEQLDSKVTLHTNE